jgi:hypothetical protein
MFELIINSVKLLISKDSRDTIEALVHILNDTEEWEKDIITMEVKVSTSNGRKNIFFIRFNYR